MAGAPDQFTLTPAMVDAGVDALVESDYGYDPTVGPDGTVCAIIRAALEAGGFQISANQSSAQAEETL